MSDDENQTGWAAPPPKGKGHGKLYWAVVIILVAWLVLSMVGCVAVMLTYG